jgi:hypothetical protein
VVITAFPIIYNTGFPYKGTAEGDKIRFTVLDDLLHEFKSPQGTYHHDGHVHKTLDLFTLRSEVALSV